MGVDFPLTFIDSCLVVPIFIWDSLFFACWWLWIQKSVLRWFRGCWGVWPVNGIMLSSFYTCAFEIVHFILSSLLFFPWEVKPKSKKKQKRKKERLRQYNYIFNPLKIVVLVSQLCPTLCNTVDCSPTGSSVDGILQARVLEWVSPGDLPDPGIEPRSLPLQADSLPSEL